MHLREPASVDKGDRVYTNQQFGVVGTTGSSTACHLHFEMWTAPGWYDGGSPIDPLAVPAGLGLVLVERAPFRERSVGLCRVSGDNA